MVKSIDIMLVFLFFNCDIIVKIIISALQILKKTFLCVIIVNNHNTAHLRKSTNRRKP